MPYYIMLTKLTDEGRKTIKAKPSRVAEVNKEVNAMGVEIVAQYSVLGPYDFVNILRAPDDLSVAWLSMELGSRGTLETTTMPAMGIDEFIRYMDAMKKAGKGRPGSK